MLTGTESGKTVCAPPRVDGSSLAWETFTMAALLSWLVPRVTLAQEGALCVHTVSVSTQPVVLALVDVCGAERPGREPAGHCRSRATCRKTCVPTFCILVGWVSWPRGRAVKNQYLTNSSQSYIGELHVSRFYCFKEQ